ncbi:MAG: peptidylprolyl isomerase [Oscillospiraceae bacterium]|nr:peptidylprolyl isomerase [Oscillospiraceae bacterium]
MNLKKTAICTAAMVLLTGLCGCGDTTVDPGFTDAQLQAISEAVVGENAFIITLYPDVAPITCKNFEKLVNAGFYNGLTFHRVIDDFMAQGGDPEGTGMGGSSETIKGEFSSNGVENNLSHQRGVVSMARSNDPNSASSQFFICYGDESFLDGNYAAFGEVTEGMEVVDSFLEVERTMSMSGEPSTPIEPIIMEIVWQIEDDAEGNPRIEVKMEPIPKSEKQEEEPEEAESEAEETSAAEEDAAAEEETEAEEETAAEDETETEEPSEDADVTDAPEDTDAEEETTTTEETAE